MKKPKAGLRVRLLCADGFLHFRSPIWALLVTGLFCLGFNAHTLADDDQQAALEQLKRSISHLEKKLQSQRQEKGQHQSQLQLIEIDAAQLNKRIRAFQTEITATKKKLVALEGKRKTLKQRIAQQRSAITKQIRSAHKLGSEEPIKLILNQEDPQQLTRILKYYDYLLDARAAKIDQFTTDINQLKLTVTDIQAAEISLGVSKKQLEAERKKLTKNIKKRKTMLSKVEAALLSASNQLTAYEKQRNELEALIKTVKKAAAPIAPAEGYPSFISSKGKLNWPVKGKLAHKFGSRRSDYLRWEGWIISAVSGAKVQAIHHGRVVFSNYLRGFGLMIIVDHGDGFMSLYAHNQELLRETGDWIQSGEIISRAGNTGGLTVPALYFEIRDKGKPINPKFWLSKR